MDAPADYAERARQAISLYGEEAEVYLQHTAIGDPLADAVVDSIADLPAADRGNIIKQILAGRLEGAAADQEVLQNFLSEALREPD